MTHLNTEKQILIDLSKRLISSQISRNRNINYGIKVEMLSLQYRMSSFIQQYKKLGIEVILIPVIQPKNRVGGVYISNFLAAMSLTLLKQKQIYAIISLGKSCCLPHTKQQIPNYLYIPVEDKVTENINQYFEKCFTFIEKCRKKTNVLIHCRAGISRSSTIILAYLIKKYTYSLRDAFALLKRAHKRAKPNQGFLQQLAVFATEITGQQQHFQMKAQSKRESPAKWVDQQPKREQSLHKIVKQLKSSGEQIDERISKIKEMLESNSMRTRKSSEYLKRRLQESRKRSQEGRKPHSDNKQTIIKNKTYHPMLSDLLVKKIEKVSRG